MTYSSSKILFLTPNCEDYLSDALLHGLRSLLKDNLIDYPKQEILYKNCSELMMQQVRGKGFTLYSGLLDDIVLDRCVKEKIQAGYFDLIIFGDIWRSFGYFLEFLPYLTYENTIILDGADTPQPYPYAGKWWRYPAYWFLPKAHTKFRYFKREWTPETIRNLWYQIPPCWLCKYIPTPKNLYPISFSIPDEKIVKDLPIKTKLFPKHIVDAEVANQVAGSVTSYAFESEADYYADLQAAKFGITTKRSGWDCLRHYEIAANGCVPCFRDLDEKPLNCAPHGLDETNCIIYHSYTDLIDKIQSLSDPEYETLQKNAFSWVKNSTTIKRAKQLLENVNYK
jgi:hypothetical protein